MNIAKKKQSHRYRTQTSDYPWGWGGGAGNEGASNYWIYSRLQGILDNMGNIVNIFLKTVNGK